jgi:hypothetical protein
VSSYPQAATLLWLVGSLEPYLPTPGRYRVLLIAFTDLHSPVPGRPQRLDEETAMGGPGFRASAFPVQRPVRAGYRAGVYVYEYEASSGEGRGRFISADPKIPAKGHVERAGLLALSSAQPCDRDE